LNTSTSRIPTNSPTEFEFGNKKRNLQLSQKNLRGIVRPPTDPIRSWYHIAACIPTSTRDNQQPDYMIIPCPLAQSTSSSNYKNRRMTAPRGGWIEQIGNGFPKLREGCAVRDGEMQRERRGDTHLAGVTEKLSGGRRRGTAAAASDRPDAVRAAAGGQRWRAPGG